MHASSIAIRRLSALALVLAAATLGCGGGTAPTGPSFASSSAVEPPASPAPDGGLGIDIPDDWQLRGTMPMDYVPGTYSVLDLDAALSRGDRSANDILWLLYWVDRVDESTLLAVLVQHGYAHAMPVAQSARGGSLADYATASDAGTGDPPSDGHNKDSSSLHQQYFSSQYPGTHDAEDSRNHDLAISRTWDHQLTVSRAEHEWDISKKFGFGHKEETSKDFQNHEDKVSKFTHDWVRSRSWPSNHYAEVSHDHPPGDEGHHIADSRIWPPNHTFQFSKGWEPPVHSASVSRGYPPNHAPGSSKNGNVTHDWRLSVQYPQPHGADVSRSHALPVSRSWPNFPTQHSVAASRTRPPNHFDAVSFTWPKDHLAVTSSSWPSNHFDAVSKSWSENDPGLHTTWWSRVVPPGHTYFQSAKDTGEVAKDIKDLLKKKKADAGQAQP